MRRLEIADPCSAAWDQMQGAGRTRRCDACDRDVHDLSARTEIEAAGLLLVLGARGLCVRFEHDGEGIVRFAPEPRAVRAPLSRAAAGLAAAASIGVAACGPVTAPPRAAPGGAGVAVPASTSTAPAPVAVAPGPDSPGPATAAVAAAPPAAPADADSDGVADPEDACPTEPGRASPDKAHNGCPARVVVVSQGDVVIMERVQFARGGRAVDERSRRILEAAAQVLKENPQIERVAVKGHASIDEPGAVKLGKARAEAVVSMLVALGVEPGRLEPRSLGAERPLADNATREGRAKNRRIEFEILSTRSCPPTGPAAPCTAAP